MGKKTKLSVVMCTYNGEAYLRAQLESLAAQTRLPDELVVYDDRSTDGTMQILEEFQTSAPFPVKLHVNKQRLGPAANFGEAIRGAAGGLIALSDQDDVWMPCKLETLEKKLDEFSEAGYAFSDALLVDETLRPLGETMWQRNAFTRRERARFAREHQLEILLRHNVVTGATMVFRAALKDLILPIPPGWMHDAWIAFVAAAAGAKGVFIEAPLVYYRQHSRQVMGAPERVGFWERLRQACSPDEEGYEREHLKLKRVLDRLEERKKLAPEVEDFLKAGLRHMDIRRNLSEYGLLKRLKLVFRELWKGHYHRFSRGWESVGKDLLIVRRRPRNGR